MEKQEPPAITENPVSDVVTIGTAAITETLSTINSIAQRILNFFLSGVIDSIEAVLPEFGEAQSTEAVAEANAQLISRIRAIVSDPKLTEEMRLLAQEVGKFLEVPMSEINTILEKEGEELVNKLTELLNRLIVKVGITAKDATLDTIGLIPGVDAVLGIFTVVSSLVSVTATTTGAMLSIFAPAFVQTLAAMAQSIKQGQSLYNQLDKFTGTLTDTIERARSATASGISQTASAVIEKATQQVSAPMTSAVATAREKVANLATSVGSVIPAVATEDSQLPPASTPAPTSAPTPTTIPTPSPSASLRGGKPRMVLSTKKRSQRSRRLHKKHPLKKTAKHQNVKN
jgi:ABC-type multidrug transport system fused ATPase/permease subunit